MIEAAKLGESLVRAGLITDDQLRQATDAQTADGADLRDLLPSMGFIEETALAAHIAREQLMHFVDPDSAEIDEDLMGKIPRELIERHQILALKGDNRVLLALSDPDDFQAIDEIQFLSNRPVESALAPKNAIKRGIARFYERAARRKATGDERRQLPEGLRRLLAIPGDTLLRALVLALVEKGEIEAERLLGHAAEVEAAKRASLAPGGNPAANKA